MPRSTAWFTLQMALYLAFFIIIATLFLNSAFATTEDQMPLMQSTEGQRSIVVIGGGAIGSSIAYFLSRHKRYDPKLHSITLVEATTIAGGSSGKAGGLLAEWATPKCLAPLSFKTHAELAKKHNGDKYWGHRFVTCAEVKLEGHNLTRSTANGHSIATEKPKSLDWLAPGVLKSYEEAGNPTNSGQVNPYMYTKTLARLAEEKGVKVVIAKATKIDYSDGAVSSVAIEADGQQAELQATDVVVAAGPWTTRLLPEVKLLAPRGHSVVVRTKRDISPYVLFPKITAAEDSGLGDLLSPEIYPRPPDALYAYDTVYASGPDDYEVGLPDDTGKVEVNEQKCKDVYTAISSVSQELHDGEVIVKQACYKPQIREHEENEEVGPMVGPHKAKGLWLATGHDEWGIQNAAGTGLIVSEMIFDGAAQSADASSLDPKHFIE